MAHVVDYSPQTDLVHDVPGKGRFGHRGTETPAALPELWMGVFLQEPEDLLGLDAEVEGPLDAIPRNGHEDNVGQPPDGMDVAEQSQHAHVEFRGRVGAQLEVGLDDDGQVARIVGPRLGQCRFKGLVRPAPHPATLAPDPAPGVVPSGQLHGDPRRIKYRRPTDLLVVDETEQTQVLDDLQSPFRQRGGRIALPEAGKAQTNQDQQGLSLDEVSLFRFRNRREVLDDKVPNLLGVVLEHEIITLLRDDEGSVLDASFVVRIGLHQIGLEQEMRHGGVGL